MTAAGVLARVPGVLLLAPLLAVGALLPGVGHPPAELIAGSVGMRHEAIGQRAVAVRCSDMAAAAEHLALGTHHRDRQQRRVHH